MILLSVAGCYVAALYGPNNSLDETLSIGLGYVSLLMLAVTLLIGPLNLLRKRRNPVNINLRRDIGIWAGITACLHVVFSLRIYPGKNIIEYFTGKSQPGLGNTFGLFEISNNIGLVATLLMVALLVTSNQVSLKLLKGKRWKFLQRFNYLLAVLSVIHTFAFQSVNSRENVFIYSVIALSVAVIAAQLTGVALHLSRARLRQTTHAQPPVAPTANLTSAPVPSGQLLIARRRFLAVTGATLLGGVAVSGTAGYLLGRSQAGAKPLTLAQVPPNTVAPANSGTNPGPGPTAATPQVGNIPPNGFDRRGRRNQNIPGNNADPTNPNSGIGQGSAGNPTQPQPASPTTPAAASGSSGQAAGSTGRSLILGNFASLPAGSALKFTTPDTGEAAFVIHEQDGSVKAYSGICTHRPYTLVFDESQKALVCNLHDVPFNIITGAPTRRPANAPLQSYKVHVDSQNNIVYDIT
jgi:sulfoxide reductase heme-binding subunit YedZ